MIKHYIISSFRNIFKNKIPAFVAIIGMAVGLICFSLCMYQRNERNNINKGYKDAERLALISLKGESTSKTPPNLIYLLRKYDIPEAELISVITSGYFSCFYEFESDNDKSIKSRESMFFADTAIIDLLSLKIIDGNTEDIKNRINSVLLTTSMAQKIYGNNNPIGRRLNLYNDPSDTESYTITGIIEDFPDNTTIGNPGIIDMSAPKGRIKDNEIYNSVSAETLVKINKGFTISDQQKRLNENNIRVNITG